MTSTEFARILTKKLKRKIKVCHIEPIASNLGKVKKAMFIGQNPLRYYWDESEIELVINELNN